MITSSLARRLRSLRGAGLACVTYAGHGATHVRLIDRR
jgi:hypothetical protein